MRNVGVSLFAGVVLCASTAMANPFGSAGVKIEARSGSKVQGTASFSADAKKQVTLTVEITGATPGTHAVHIHETGDCSSPDGNSAGGHWNPTHAAHGAWSAAAHHLGDVGNLTVGADGKGKLTLTTDKWTIGGGGPNDVLGHAIVVHGGVDDMKTQPTGNAGNRIGCGVIAATIGGVK